MVSERQKVLDFIGGADADRTRDLLNAIQALSQTELQPHRRRDFSAKPMRSVESTDPSQTARFVAQPSLYSAATLSAVIARSSSSGTPSKSRAITSREFGQVESEWGKSDAHIRFFTPIKWRETTPTRSS